MNDRLIRSSLTRISDLSSRTFDVSALSREEWDTGDYVVAEVTDASGYRTIELPNGREMEVARGDAIIGAFGTRYATLEVTGSWEAIGDDGRLHALTRAGLFGREESRSTLVQAPLTLQYRGHVTREEGKVGMTDFVPPSPDLPFDVPTVLLVGTSMSAGKTTAARIVTRRLKGMGLSVLGAKLAGAGRFRDVLSVHDAGADWIFDFVDAGLPSTIGPKDEVRSALRRLLGRMAEPDADVAVVEVGASPLEPYNGDVVVEELHDAVDLTILCASDPYAVLGVQRAFDRLKPDLVTGIATNTEAGVSLLDRLTDLPAFNIRDAETHDRLDAALRDRLSIPG
jgi:hypothetical protein